MTGPGSGHCSHATAITIVHFRGLHEMWRMCRSGMVHLQSHREADSRSIVATMIVNRLIKAPVLWSHSCPAHPELRNRPPREEGAIEDDDGDGIDDDQRRRATTMGDDDGDGRRRRR